MKPAYRTKTLQEIVQNQAKQIRELREVNDNLRRNKVDYAHALSDVRRYLEAKFMTVADLPSEEAVITLYGSPEIKHEADTIIAAIGRVVDWYENQVPTITLSREDIYEEVVGGWGMENMITIEDLKKYVNLEGL